MSQQPICVNAFSGKTLHRTPVFYNTDTSKAVFVPCAPSYCGCNALPLLTVLSNVATVSRLLFVVVLFLCLWLVTVLDINRYPTGWALTSSLTD